MVTCIVFITIIYTLITSKKLNGNLIIKKAVNNSKYEPTVFIIYDNSTKLNCDRLIIIEPFGWVIWAINQNLYILNVEGGRIECGVGSTPAVHVYNQTRFIDTCLKIDYHSLLAFYSNKKCFTIPYNLTSNKFTIISALNLLCSRWITFNPIIDLPIAPILLNKNYNILQKFYAKNVGK